MATNKNTNTTTQIIDECPICYENYTKTLRKKIICPNCKFSACKICLKKILLNTQQRPHCYKCKTQWKRQFLVDNFNKCWLKKDYRIKRTELLFEEQKTLLPTTMYLVEKHNKAKIHENKANQLNIEIQKLIKMREEEWNKVHEINCSNNFKKEKRIYIKNCPINNCNGLLSLKYKCGVCNIKVCVNCLEIKNEEHKCKEANLKTTALLKKDTKPCPKCNTLIHRISGCDQMFCIMDGCHTAFNWKTGNVINGPIHNPHYFEYMSDTNNTITNNPGYHPCGGLPYFPSYKTIILSAISPNGRWGDNIVYKDSVNLYREISHFQNWELDRIRRNIQKITENKENLRFKFLMNFINEKAFKAKLIKDDTNLEKKTAILQIYELANTVMIENINNLYNTLREKHHSDNKTNKTKYEEQKCANELLKICKSNINNVRKYANDELFKVSKNYFQKVPLIQKNLYSINVIVNSKTIKTKLFAQYNC